MNFQTMHKQRKFTALAAIVGIISIFLPWFVFSDVGIFDFSTRINGFHEKGIVVFFGFVAALLLSSIGDTEKAFDKTKWMGVLLAGAFSLLFTIIVLSRGSVGGNYITIGFKTGIGIWLSLIASAGVIGAAWMYKSAEMNLQSGFESLKKDISSSVNTLQENQSSKTTSKIDELEKLIKMKNEGNITQEEFDEMKKKI